MEFHCSGRNLHDLVDASPWYAEDLTVGDWMELGSIRVDLDEIIDFATKYDPLPIHVAGTDSPFGGVIASGMHTMALYSSLASRVFMPRLALIAGKGIDRLRLPAPVYPGRTLTGTIEIIDNVGRAGRADISHRSTMTDDRGAVVLSFTGVAVVASGNGA